MLFCAICLLKKLFDSLIGYSIVEEVGWTAPYRALYSVNFQTGYCSIELVSQLLIRPKWITTSARSFKYNLAIDLLEFAQQFLNKLLAITTFDEACHLMEICRTRLISIVAHRCHSKNIELVMLVKHSKYLIITPLNSFLHILRIEVAYIMASFFQKPHSFVFWNAADKDNVIVWLDL